MKIFCISDNLDMAVGLRLSGVESVVLNRKSEIIEQINKINSQKDIGILAITEVNYNLAKQEIEEFMQNNNLPLIVKIPSMS